MTTLKAAVARNQDLLDKVTKENEALVVVCRNLKDELAAAQEALARCKAETLKSMEPQIQKILDDHKHAMQCQAAEHERQLAAVTAPVDADLALRSAQADEAIKKLEAECKAKLHQMKDAALAEERKMKDELAAKMANVPREIEGSKQAVKEKLQNERME